MNSLIAFVETFFPNKEYHFFEKIQSLWSGYGSIERWKNSKGESIVIKHIQLPDDKNHPRGWNSNLGHLRKVKSYEVEKTWYEDFAHKSLARVPRKLIHDKIGDSQVIVLEDLNASGFPVRAECINEKQFKACISWLAQFHAGFMNNAGNGLWETGTYWHLNTRPEEFDVMKSGPLKKYASEIDRILSSCKYKTLVHGDSKLANFCFSKEGKVAAVDFQYVGMGCGMKDLIYFISSVEDFENEDREKEVLDFYFDELARFLGERNEELEREWRSLYKFAWADFNRFLQGWSPGHWKLNDYVDEITSNAIWSIQCRELLKIAKKSALEAGKFIQNNINACLNIESKGSHLSRASSIVTEVDKKAQAIILKFISPTLKRYNLGLLSEELIDDSSRFKKDFFWCIDPLDGTLPFTEQVEGYSVAIALVSRDGTPVLGVIYNPRKGDLYTCIKGEGAFKNGIPISVKPSKEKFTCITDRSFTKLSMYDEFVANLEDKAKNKGLHQFQVIAHGGASMNAIWVLENAPAAYIKLPKKQLGGGGIWDFAASSCLFKELSLRATNFEGGKLDLNRKDSAFMNHEGVWFES